MNVDSIFTIGKTHKVCQDYTTSGLAAPNAPFIVVSDGCSSSPDTDFGARLLTRVCSSFYTDNREIDPEEIMLEAEDMSRLLALDPLSLDATLLCASYKEAFYDIRILGDGVAVKTTQDGTHEVVIVEYPSGAPYYPSYSLDPERKINYIEKFGIKKKVNRFNLSSSGLMSECQVKEDEEGLYYHEHGVAAQYTSISLMSDGILSFYKLVNTYTSKLQTPLPLTEVLKKLLSFKGYQGDFVQRRVQKFKKDIDKENWHHADDLSLATMYLGD